MDHAEVRLAHARQLGTLMQKRAHVFQTSVADRADQAVHGGAVNERFELWPALESVRPRQHQLGLL